MAKCTVGDEHRILQLLQEERGYYSLILNLEWQERVDLDDVPLPVAQFRSLQRKKKHLIACIQEVEVELEPLKGLWKQEKNHTGLASREIEQELDALDKLLREIIGLAEKNSAMMRRRIRRAKQQAKEL